MKVWYIDPFSIDQFVNYQGVDRFKCFIRSLGWIVTDVTPAADAAGIDLMARIEHAKIDIQIKCSNLMAVEDKRDGSWTNQWNWNIFKKELRIKFYKERDSFLGLVGLYVKEVSLGYDIKHFIELMKPMIGLIPGSEVIRHFGKGALKRGKITMIKGSDSRWTKYFQFEYIEGLLHAGFERQRWVRPPDKPARSIQKPRVEDDGEEEEVL